MYLGFMNVYPWASSSKVSHSVVKKDEADGQAAWNHEKAQEGDTQASDITLILFSF